MADVELQIDAEVIESEPPLEEKYRTQMRQIVSQKIELPISTLPEMIKSQIDLNPDFQRREIWDDARRSRFVESIIMNVPIPPVFLGEDDYGKYVVLDGRQRLTAIHDFLNNVYKLKKLSVWSELNDSTYRDLQKKRLDRALLRRFIPAIVILKESSAVVKYDVFDRLNTGGMVALPMEIRNAVYRGKFNRLLHSLSDDKTFRKLWNISENDEEREKDKTYQRMEDVQLVLRFFALIDYQSMNLRFSDYLSDFMDRRNKEYAASPALEETDRQRFKRAVTNCWNVFGDTAFTRPQPDGTRSGRSGPLSDAEMIALCDVEPAPLIAGVRDQIRGSFDRLCTNDPDFLRSITAGTNGKGAIETRISKGVEAVREILARN